MYTWFQSFLFTKHCTYMACPFLSTLYSV